MAVKTKTKQTKDAWRLIFQHQVFQVVYNVFAKVILVIEFFCGQKKHICLVSSNCSPTARHLTSKSQIIRIFVVLKWIQYSPIRHMRYRYERVNISNVLQNCLSLFWFSLLICLDVKTRTQMKYYNEYEGPGDTKKPFVCQVRCLLRTSYKSWYVQFVKLTKIEKKKKG